MAHRQDADATPLILMKTNIELLIITFCTAAFLFTGTALTQELSPPPPDAAPAGASPRMKAVVYHEYGSPDVLRLEEVEKPAPNDNQLLIKVSAVSVNPLDWHFMEGTPYIMRAMGVGLLKPTVERLGVDYAGTVEAIGKNVTQFKPGDEVFGGKNGAFAEYICVLADRAVVLKPANITFEQAASVPIAAITALQGLRDDGKVQPGQKVLINGASGGVGTFAVQIAKSLGAEVTGVCSTRNVDMVRSLGADHVIDYIKEDFTKSGQRYDVILDNVGTQPLLGFTRVLNPKGKYVLIGGGGPNDAGWVGPLARPIKAMMLSPFVTQQMGMMFADLNKKDLTVLADLMQSGKVTPVIDRTYPLSQISDALRYLEQGHARGKVAITLKDTNETAPASANVAADSVSRTGPVLLAFEFIAVVIAVTIVPIILALALNRRFRQRNPGKRPYRWGYYFGILSFLVAIGLANIFGLGVSVVIVSGVIYGVLAWFFAQRQHWAWITLTVLSFNPIAWIINSIYFWKRWSEDSVAAQA
jgi:NADPH:quinone reductase-like Zn-dependent oxidoreductase